VLQDWRRKLLRVVKGDVDERLEKSLHNQVLIPLDMDEWGKQSLVPQPEDTNKQQANFLVATAELLKPIVSWIRSGQNTPLPPQTKIIDVFHQEGKLLILGSPGSGKTTLLLQLAQDLIANAEADENKPIPVIFELTNWKNNQRRHTPGILVLSDKLTIGQTIDELILIAEASFDGEYQDQIVHLPVPQ